MTHVLDLFTCGCGLINPKLCASRTPFIAAMKTGLVFIIERGAIRMISNPKEIGISNIGAGMATSVALTNMGKEQVENSSSI